MRTNYRVNSGVRFRLLSENQLEELFWGALRVLERTGLDVHHEGAREILQDAGAWVDGIRVRVPSHVVRRALALARTLWCPLDAQSGKPTAVSAEVRARFSV